MSKKAQETAAALATLQPGDRVVLDRAPVNRLVRVEGHYCGLTSEVVTSLKSGVVVEQWLSGRGMMATVVWDTGQRWYVEQRHLLLEEPTP